MGNFVAPLLVIGVGTFVYAVRCVIDYCRANREGKAAHFLAAVGVFMLASYLFWILHLYRIICFIRSSRESDQDTKNESEGTV